jgi:hypothetical protein
MSLEKEELMWGKAELGGALPWLMEDHQLVSRVAGLSE